MSGLETSSDYDYKGGNDEGKNPDVVVAYTENPMLNVDESRLRWKTDLRLIPLVCVTYMIQSLDKSTLSYAAVFGLRADAHLHGTQYSWLGAIFFLGYLIWEYPTNLMLQRFPVGKVLSGTVFAWGVVLLLHAAGYNFAGLAAARFFLGICEASVIPAVMLIMGMWYTRDEQPLRFGIWLGSSGISYIFGGLLNYGIGHAHTAITNWKLVFLIFGSFTVFWGVVLYFFLPNSPMTATFLTEDERRATMIKIETQGTGVENKTFKKEQVVACLLDVKTWLFFTFAVSSNAPNGGLSTFVGLIIEGMGFSRLRTTLMQTPIGGVAFLASVIATIVATKFRNTRLLMIAVCLTPFLAGLIGFQVIAHSNLYARLACLWLCYTYTGAWTLLLAMVNASTAGHTKKVTTNAIVLIGYCLGNFIGPFFFKSEQAPQYGLGISMMFFCTAIQYLSVLGLFCVLWWRNRQRKNPSPAQELESHVQATQDKFLDMTDTENKSFRYVY